MNNMTVDCDNSSHPLNHRSHYESHIIHKSFITTLYTLERHTVDTTPSRTDLTHFRHSEVCLKDLSRKGASQKPVKDILEVFQR